MRILTLFAHPAFHKSKVNKLLVEGLSEIEGLTFHDLYQEYPDSYINVKKEQELLMRHDVIMFQFPLFWYSTPSILKEWQDMVLEHGWAFGSKGNALKDKLFFCSITSGGPRKAYQTGGYHNITLKELLSPIRQTATLCKMKPLPPFVIHGTHAIETNEVLANKRDLLKALHQLIDDDFDIDDASKFDYLNDYITKHG